jgi:hypothetical protein
VEASATGKRRLRIAFTLFLAAYGFVCLRSPADYGWLDSLDLAVHESGHLVFGFDGEFLQFLGGTLMQLLVPAAFVAYFWRRGDRYAATVPLWWAGQNCWNIGVYVRDARTQELPLVGGGEHDWFYLLGELDWLGYDQRLGWGIHGAGVVLYLLAIAGGWYLAVHDQSPDD